MARTSPSAFTRTVFLLLGEDPFRSRLRLAELVASLTGARPDPPEVTDLARWPSPDLGSPIGVTRHDARTDAPSAILLSGQAQGLFAAADERAVVVVEHAEALREHAFIAGFPEEAALVLVTTERVPAARARRATSRAPKRDAGAVPTTSDLPQAVGDAGGRTERIARLMPAEMPAWISARAVLARVELAPAAIVELASAVGTDTDRLEGELAKLRAFAAGKRVEPADVKALVSGAIESDVFALTEAVVRHDARSATLRLEQLLADGQAPQQILALLLWQFRVLLFAGVITSPADAERAAKAIRSSPGAIQRWRSQAPRVSLKDIRRAYEVLYATDLAIKQGRTEPENALLLCVLDLCGVAGADPRELVVGEPPRR